MKILEYSRYCRSGFIPDTPKKSGIKPDLRRNPRVSTTTHTYYGVLNLADDLAFAFSASTCRSRGSALVVND